MPYFLGPGSTSDPTGRENQQQREMCNGIFLCFFLAFSVWATAQGSAVVTNGQFTNSPRSGVAAWNVLVVDTNHLRPAPTIMSDAPATTMAAVLVLIQFASSSIRHDLR
jgi:hypothetical protein